MVLDQNLITFLDVLGPEEQLHGHARQDGLFVGGGPTKTNFAFLHPRKVKNLPWVVPQKVLRVELAKG
jgi:hypothetical protein